ncbi:ATP-binding cassette domain-containing protein [Dellaglioa sp. L3N]
MTRLEVFKVTKEIEGQKILNVSHLNFENSGIYGLVGPNGAGKTTFLKCICGLLFPENGKICIDQLELNKNNRETFLKKIGSVFAQSDSIFDLSIKELLEEHYYYFNLSEPKEWRSVLKNVGLDVSPNQKIGSLSLGMRQRLLLAVAISHNPEILILDEPFNGLDPDGVVMTKQFIQRLAEDKVVIITSHSFADLMDIITDALVMTNGQTSDIKSLSEISQLFSDGLMGFYHNFIEQKAH